MINLDNETPVDILPDLKIDFDVVTVSKEDFQTKFLEIVKDYDFFMKASNLKILEDFSEYLSEDTLVGFYYTDFIKAMIPIYHCSFPSYSNNYPCIIVNTKRGIEAASNNGNIIEYLKSRYIVKHIPRLICEVL
jgi:hypothetical protein